MNEVILKFIKRMIELYDLVEVDEDVSVVSLRNALYFLCMVELKKSPAVALTDENEVYCSWRNKVEERISLHFDSNGKVVWVRSRSEGEGRFNWKALTISMRDVVDKRKQKQYLDDWLLK